MDINSSDPSDLGIATPITRRKRSAAVTNEREDAVDKRDKGKKGVNTVMETLKSRPETNDVAPRKIRRTETDADVEEESVLDIFERSTEFLKQNLQYQIYTLPPDIEFHRISMAIEGMKEEFKETMLNAKAEHEKMLTEALQKHREELVRKMEEFMKTGAVESMASKNPRSKKKIGEGTRAIGTSVEKVFEYTSDNHNDDVKSSLEAISAAMGELIKGQKILENNLEELKKKNKEQGKELKQYKKEAQALRTTVEECQENALRSVAEVRSFFFNKMNALNGVEWIDDDQQNEEIQAEDRDSEQLEEEKERNGEENLNEEPPEYFEHRGVQYEIISKTNVEIASGHFSDVLLVKDSKNRKFEIKKLPLELAVEQQQIFYELSEVDHIPKSLCIPDMFLGRNLDFMMKMSRIRGTSMHTAMITEKLLFPLEIIWEICFQMSDAILFLHNNRLIYTELKLERIFLRNFKYNEDFQVFKVGAQLCNFDELIKEDAEPEKFKQSLDCRSPEVALGIPCNRMIDIWSLGLAFIKMISKGHFVLMSEDEAKEGGWNTEEQNDALLGMVETVIGPVPESMIRQTKIEKFKAGAFRSPTIVGESQTTLDDVLEELIPKGHRLQNLVRRMLSVHPAERPTADVIVKEMKEITPSCGTP